MKVKDVGAFWACLCEVGKLHVPTDGRWKYDGNGDSPTFSPSVRQGSTSAHWTITNGIVQFHSDDPKHPNQNFPLLEWDDRSPLRGDGGEVGE